MTRQKVLSDIERERERQDALHPNFSEHKRLAILVEEVGEVAQSIQEDTNLYEEIIHVASVCVRWAEEVRRLDDDV